VNLSDKVCNLVHYLCADLICPTSGCIFVGIEGLSCVEIVLQGIYRKPMLCRERHKFLSERLGTEIQENSDDFSPVQLSNAPPAGIPKVCFNCISTGEFHMYIHCVL
jgi:hypothetical protein